MSTTDYVIIDIDNQEVYNKRTGQFSKNLTLGCSYRGQWTRRKGWHTSKLCDKKHLELWQKHGEVRNIEIHSLLKVVSDSGYNALHGRNHVRINLPA